MTQFLRLSAKLIINLDRIDYIDWDCDSEDDSEDSTPCIQIVFGCEYLFIPKNSEAANVLRNYFQGQGQGETDSDSELIHQVIGQALAEELEALADASDLDHPDSNA